MASSTTMRASGSRGRIRETRCAIPQDVEHLGARPLGDLGMTGQEVPRPRERDGRRLVAGEEEGHHLVTELARRHALARVLVACGHEHAEEIVARLVGAPARVDHVVDERVEHADRAAERVGALRRPPDGRHDVRHPAVRRHLEGHAERLAGVTRLARQVAAEERLAHDGERERVHLGADVDRLAAPHGRLPRVETLGGAPDHGAGEACDPLAMEGGLRQRRWRRQKSPSLVKSPSPISTFTRPMIRPFT
jgi:hypothetical protein